MSELYKKYRPTLLDEVVGNASLKAQLRAYVKAKSTPHFLLLVGPSGCGKTTLARILARGLKVQDLDYIEMNCAADNGVDMVRNLREKQGLAPMASPARIIVIDECHQLTKQAQEALLKMLEDTPQHVYYVFCTTDPGKLLATIKTRATQLTVDALKPQEAVELLTRVCGLETKPVPSEDVVDALVEAAGGSARKLLVLLGQVLTAATPEAQLAVIAKPEIEKTAFEVAQALQNNKGWAVIAPMLKTCQDDPETVRRVVAGYFATVVLGATKSPERPAKILECVADTWYDTPKVQMVLALYKASQIK